MKQLQENAVSADIPPNGDRRVRRSRERGGGEPSDLGKEMPVV